MASDALNQLYNDLDDVLIDEDLDDVINVLTTILAECLAQASDNHPDKELMAQAAQHLFSTYAMICSTPSSVTIN